MRTFRTPAALLSDTQSWALLSSHLDHVLDLCGEERERWLTELGANEPQIANALQEFLRENQALERRGFLNSPLPVNELLMDSPLCGKKVGAYTLDRLLGRGGMGEVWSASRTDGRFEGRCAIKFLDRSLAHAKVADRFHREGRLLAGLTHPNIARLLDAGATDDGCPYLVLEYVDGERIDRYCESRSLSVKDRVRLFIDVVSAVAHAHANLIIHRDLKPSNVLVDTKGTVKLLDFGIAKLVDNEMDVAHTRLEEVALTPEYAAPEQLLGDLPSTATDVYQLGMLLYVLLTGRHPLQLSGTRAERVRTALDGRAPRASEFASRANLKKQLRGDLDAILAMALRKDAKERYATATTLREELLRFLNQEPVLARRGAAWYVVRKFISRHRMGVAAATAAVVVLCAALIFAIEQARESALQADRAALEMRRAALEAKKANSQLSFMAAMMWAVGDWRRAVSPEEILESGADLLETRFAHDPPFVARELIHISGRFVNWNKRHREYDLVSRAEVIARRSADPLALARVECFLTGTEIGLGRVERAMARLQEGREALARAKGADVFDAVDCLTAAAELANAQGRFPEALSDFNQSLALMERSGVPENVHYAYVLDQHAQLLRLSGDTQRAYELIHRSQTARQNIALNMAAARNAGLHAEAVALYDLGEVRAAFAMESQAMKGELQSGSQHSINPVMSNFYGHLLLRTDDVSGALQWFDRALKDSVVTEDGDTILRAHIGRANALLTLHRTEEAKQELKMVKEPLKSEPLQLRSILAEARLVEVKLLASEGLLTEARDLTDQLRKQFGDRNLGLGLFLDDALLAASRISLSLGAPETESLAEEALRLCKMRARDATVSADVGEATLALAQARLAQQDWAGASRTAREAQQILARSLGAEHSLTVQAQEIVETTTNRSTE